MNIITHILFFILLFSYLGCSSIQKRYYPVYREKTGMGNNNWNMIDNREFQCNEGNTEIRILIGDPSVNIFWGPVLVPLFPGFRWEGKRGIHIILRSETMFNIDSVLSCITFRHDDSIQYTPISLWTDLSKENSDSPNSIYRCYLSYNIDVYYPKKLTITFHNYSFPFINMPCERNFELFSDYEIRYVPFEFPTH